MAFFLPPTPDPAPAGDVTPDIPYYGSNFCPFSVSIMKDLKSDKTLIGLLKPTIEKVAGSFVSGAPKSILGKTRPNNFLVTSQKY